MIYIPDQAHQEYKSLNQAITEMREKTSNLLQKSFLK